MTKPTDNYLPTSLSSSRFQQKSRFEIKRMTFIWIQINTCFTSSLNSPLLSKCLSTTCSINVILALQGRPEGSTEVSILQAHGKLITQWGTARFSGFQWHRWLLQRQNYSTQKESCTLTCVNVPYILTSVVRVMYITFRDLYYSGGFGFVMMISFRSS